MIIGVIGATSNIASKAYLPVYASLQDKYRFILYSREWVKAESVREQYKFEYATEDLSALETVDMVILHAATSQHFELAKRYLSAGVHVLMDKPISENFEEVKALYKLAEEKNVLFVIAFNRRFAPQTDKLKAIKNKNFISVTKNLSDNAGETLFTMYDIFIHPLDMMLYLLDDELKDYHYDLRKDEQGKVVSATVMGQTAQTTAIARMNLQAGAFTEEFVVESPEGTYKLSDLTELEVAKGMEKTKTGVNGWNPATTNRGFDFIVKGMIESVEKFDGLNRQELLEGLKQEKILQSHEIISEMIK
ncbi:MAG: Gfo/Idh/MocA family oxidoreductase [Streptococcaceae bacterium]|nr:Gfo/Idh/MocA family oxidoreductase [Streptococcaceae bacterium]